MPQNPSKPPAPPGGWDSLLDAIFKRRPLPPAPRQSTYEGPPPDNAGYGPPPPDRTGFERPVGYEPGRWNTDQQIQTTSKGTFPELANAGEGFSWANYKPIAPTQYSKAPMGTLKSTNTNLGGLLNLLGVALMYRDFKSKFEGTDDESQYRDNVREATYGPAMAKAMKKGPTKG